MATAAQLKAERIAAQEEARMVKQLASIPTATQQAQTAIVAQVVAAAIVASPAIVNTPAGKAPSPAEVQSVAKEVAAAVAPIVAPTLPPATIQTIIQETAKVVVANPEVKAADVGQTVAPTVIQKIADTVTQAPEVVKTIIEPSINTTPKPIVASTPYNPLSGNTPDSPLSTPTSGLIPNFTPSVKIPEPAVQPGQSGFVGPVVKEPTLSTREQYEQGLSGGLYGSTPVNPTPTGPTAPTVQTGGGNTIPNKSVWKKAGTVMTLQGPVDVDANGIAENGSVPISSENNSSLGETTNELSASDKDAYALLKEVFINYGLEELVPAITKLMSNNVGPNQASLMLKTNPEYNAAYIKRFAGNEARRKAGLNVLSEAEYLDLENSYSQTLNAYGVKNYFGTTTEAKRNAMAGIIGNDISATEFKDRVETVVTRVNNADPKIKETLKNFYDIKDEDLTSYFLNPKDNLPKLQEKVTAAEIGAAAASQNLAYSKTSAEDLAKFGITKAQAQEGYSTIGEIMPTATKLGEIYGDQYTQATAEQEVFKGTASAKRKRQQLAEREAASFSGSSGRLRTGKAKGNEGSF